MCGRGGCCCVYHCVRSYGHVVCVGGEVVAVSIIVSGHVGMQCVCVGWGGGGVAVPLWSGHVGMQCVCVGGGVAVPLWSGHVGMQCVCVGGGCCCAFVVRSCGHAVCVCWGGGVAVPLWSGHVGMQCVCVGGEGEVLLCLCGPVMWACSVCVLGGGCCAFVVRSCGHAVCVCVGGGGCCCAFVVRSYAGMQGQVRSYAGCGEDGHGSGCCCLQCVVEIGVIADHSVLWRWGCC